MVHLRYFSFDFRSIYPDLDSRNVGKYTISDLMRHHTSQKFPACGGLSKAQNPAKELIDPELMVRKSVPTKAGGDAEQLN